MKRTVIRQVKYTLLSKSSFRLFAVSDLINIISSCSSREEDIVELLIYHYGDGLVYIPKQKSRQLYVEAASIGYINKEGYLTKKGRVLLAKYS